VEIFCFAFGYMAACTNTKKIPRRLVAITLSNVYAVNVMEQAFWTDLKILVGRHKQAKLAGKIERSVSLADVVGLGKTPHDDGARATS
jgi:hypothetical protein